MSNQPCGCDEVIALRSENTRLRGIIEGMREGLLIANLPKPSLVQHQGKPHSRCTAIGNPLMGAGQCELPEGHGGYHRWCQIAWPR